MADTDLCIIGAGPAGMAAARTAAEAGVACVLLDEQAAPGGQIYRDVTRAGDARRRLLGPDYEAGRPLAAELDHPGIEHQAGATVWCVQPDGTVGYSRASHGRVLRARHVILATGALERPVPLPGWTLPGVMPAGAAQILLKTAGLLPERVVIAGSGPLLYLLAWQLIQAGQPPLALVETQPRSAPLRALPHLPRALRGWRPLAKGLGLLWAIRRAGVPRHQGAEDLQILGEDSAAGLAFRAGGRRRQVDCDTVLLHQGVVPSIQITRALGCAHRWDEAQACFHPVLDPWGRTSVERVFVAGDAGAIHGAAAAEIEGRLAALEVARSLGALTREARDSAAAPRRRALAREQAARPLLDAMYAPPASVLRPADDTIVCRCEEVTAGEIRRLGALGCQGPNQAKAMSRCGMGPCQGRYCGLTVTQLLAEATGRSPDAVGYYRIRTPVKPITVGELAELDSPPAGAGRTTEEVCDEPD